MGMRCDHEDHCTDRGSRVTIIIGVQPLVVVVVVVVAVVVVVVGK